MEVDVEADSVAEAIDHVATALGEVRPQGLRPVRAIIEAPAK